MGFIQIISVEERFELAFDESVLVLRRICAEVDAEITARHTTRQALPNGKWEERVNANEVLHARLDHALLDWRNVIHPVTLKPVPCTPENKRMLPLRVMERVMTVVNGASEAAEEEAAEDMADLERFLAVKADYPGLNCEECRGQREAGEPEPDCAACPVTSILGDHTAVLRIHDLISSPLFINYPALVPGALDLILPPMPRNKAAAFILKLALVCQFRRAAGGLKNGH